MWICTTIGFFSVVLDRASSGGESTTCLVRARDRHHLERFLARMPGNYPIIETPANDYLFRARVPRRQVAVTLEQLMREVDYTNFKGAVEARNPQDRSYIDALHDVWSVMRGYLQRRQPAKM